MTRAILSLCLLALASLACAFSAASAPTLASISWQAPASLASPVAPMVGDNVTVTAWEAVYIRDAASEHGKVIGYKTHGESVRVLSCSNGWAQVGKSRWMNAAYLAGEVCP